MARSQNRHHRAVPLPIGSDELHFRAGSELREARERLGWDLGEVAAALRIKLSYLQAIEDGRVSALPGNAYALGFLRTYATTLGLDADDVARRFRAEAQDVNRKPDLAFPSPVPERGLPIGAMALLGLVILIVGYAAWYRFSEHEQVATHTVPPVPEQLLAAPKAAPVSPQVASVMPPPGSVPPQLPPTTAPSIQPAPAAAAPAVPAIVPKAPSVTPAPQTASAPATQPKAQATSAPAPTTPAPAQPAASQPTPFPAAQTTATPPVATGLVLRATAPTWVQVRGSDGHVVYDHVMQAGDTWPVPPADPGLMLTTGNAGGLIVSDNGTDLGSFGRTGSVRHNIALTKDGVKQAVQPSAGLASSPAAAVPPVHRTVHHAPLPPARSDDSADQLNARQLGPH